MTIWKGLLFFAAVYKREYVGLLSIIRNYYNIPQNIAFI